ncbi:clumping factor B-like [Helianthus annuus]|uniref:clumping factor B-like n=1 Tax=Helianthus annuus TaxID=4232 RepID=UPI001652B934|nr:clumping factor B-like [Helianthus annuus]
MYQRDCPLLKEGNSETTPAVKQITVEENKNNASPSTPKPLVVKDYDWSEEIAEAKEQVNKALMAKISSESSSKQFEKQTVRIPKGDNTADKGLRSILTSMEPENEKKSGEGKEHVSEKVSDQEKGKEKVPAAAMKTESSKEKADKDLVNSIPLSFKEKLCTPACVDVVAHYKSLNLEFERQKDKALKFNNELKQNEAAYQRNQKAFTDIKNCQRPTFVKDGIGYKDRHGNERKLFFPPHSKNYVPMPTPHPENDLKNEKAFVEQNDFCENETTANCSKSNADPIVCKEDVCDEDGDCGGSKIGIGYSGDIACESPVFVPELKKNSFGKFLTEEIPEFIPSRTGMTDSEKSVTEDHGNEDSSITASEDEQGSESSSEDQTTSGESLEFPSDETQQSSSEDQTTNDESFKCSNAETIEDQDSESSNEDQSYNESSYEASEEQSSSEDNTSESSSDSDSDEEYSEDESRVDK